MLNSNPTDFCTGVAGYPEKHMEAPSIESDIHFLKKKIKAGADYIITQMFFDNKKFFDYEKMCRKEYTKIKTLCAMDILVIEFYLAWPFRYSLIT